MIDSRCGLHCTNCEWKEACGCGGCIETMGKPFHGECQIAVCCQNKGLDHCGECSMIPCSKLYSYSYLDPEHGDKPQGARVEVCRRWAAERGKYAFSKVLLTSSGFEDFEGNQKENITKSFLSMLDKPASEAKVLFIPTAATSKEAIFMVDCCKRELLHTGVLSQNITTYDIDGRLSENEAMSYDVIYFTGGDAHYLLSRVKKTGFDKIIKKMIYENKVFVGVSAGSMIAVPNIGDPFDESTAALCIMNAYLSVHCDVGRKPRTDLPLPHIPLTDNQAIIVTWEGYRIIEG